MPLDNAAAQNAQSLLNGIDYSALIGGPLTAAIKAQAMAARSTWEFIQEVGLNTDKDGNKSAVNVTFLYQKDGELVRLVVPILTIVPIPLIIVDEVDIAFKANINASASQASEQSESTAMAGELTATGSIGWGPFSLSATVKASYSSKKDSKATQDSHYSVEYTQDVHVHATQAGMPAGLSTVLNILSSAAGTGSRDGVLEYSPKFASLNLVDPNQRQNLQLTVKDANGLNVHATSVKLEGKPAWLTVGRAPLGAPIPDLNDIKTDDRGGLALLFWIKAADQQAASAADPFEIKLSTKIGTCDKAVLFPMKVVGALPAPACDITSLPAPPVTFAHGTPQTVTFKAAAGGNPMPAGTTIAVNWTDPAGNPLTVKQGTNVYAKNTAVPLDAAGLALSVDAAQPFELDFTVTVQPPAGAAPTTKAFRITAT